VDYRWIIRRERMELTAEDLKPVIEPLVRELIAKFVQENELRARELSLMERVVRVEEELKNLNKMLMVIEEANQKRFEAMEKRLNFMQWFMGIGFGLLGLLITVANFLAR
jgi:hypothetical protein